MKDQKLIKSICEEFDLIIASHYNMTKKEYIDNENLRNSSFAKIHAIGKNGVKISKKFKKRYSYFIWPLFFFMQIWDDEDIELVWELLKGNVNKDEAFIGYNEDLKSILRAEIIKKEQGESSKEYQKLIQRLKNQEQQRLHTEEFFYKQSKKGLNKTQIIYTPMGNKR